MTTRSWVIIAACIADANGGFDVTEGPEPTGDEIDAAGGRGEFLHATYSSVHGRRDYRLYLPFEYTQREHALPLVVMLHGCAHTPENFAAGTRMNALADEHGFIVAYPRQRARDNRGQCWNWYRPRHQTAEQGEPAILAGMVR